MTCTEATPDHNNGTGTDAIEAAEGDPILHIEATTIEPAITHYTGHTTDSLQSTAHQVITLRNTVHHVNVHPTDHQNIFHTTEDHAVQDHTQTNQGTQKLHLNRNRKVHIEEPPSDFHSSENNSTDLGEELGSLN